MQKMGQPVDVIEGIDATHIPPALLQSQTPLLLKGLVKSWPAVQAGINGTNASADYLTGLYSGLKVVQYHCAKEKAGRYFYSDDYQSLDFDAQVTTLDKVLQQLKAAQHNPDAGHFYVGSTTVDECLPHFRAQNPMNLGERDPLVSVWLGNQSRVAAHFDAPDNLACCVAGKRTFTLFPIDQIDNLYVGPIDLTPSGQMISTVDIANPDLNAHPKFAQAMPHAIVAELEPGDALIVPSMWWHHVESHEPYNVLVNYWWRSAPKFMDAPINLIYHAILTLRDLPEREKKAWQTVINHFIFDEQSDKYAHIPKPARGHLNPLDDLSARRLRSLLLNKLNR